MNPKIINLLDFEYPSILHNNESEQILMKAVNSRKTKLVLKKSRSVLNQNTVKEQVNKNRTPIYKNRKRDIKTKDSMKKKKH